MQVRRFVRTEALRSIGVLLCHTVSVGVLCPTCARKNIPITLPRSLHLWSLLFLLPFSPCCPCICTQLHCLRDHCSHVLLHFSFLNLDGVSPAIPLVVCCHNCSYWPLHPFSHFFDRGCSTSHSAHLWSFSEVRTGPLEGNNFTVALPFFINRNVHFFICFLAFSISPLRPLQRCSKACPVLPRFCQQVCVFLQFRIQLFYPGLTRPPDSMTFHDNN